MTVMDDPTDCSPDFLAPPTVVSAVASSSQVPSLRRNGAPPLGLRNFFTSSCYLNSVLQCLTFTPPLAEYCRRKAHSVTCPLRAAGECTFCILESRIYLLLETQPDVNVGTPRRLYRKMTSNPDYFLLGRHEDAHELLRYLIDECAVPGMHPGSPNDPKSVMDGIFGGVLQSCIECKLCGAQSTKQDEMFDLNLDVFSEHTGADQDRVVLFASSLARIFARFFRSEILDGDNKYSCESCKSLSPARKRLSIFRAPKVFTIQLKRFCPLTASKLHHHIKFEQRLCIAKYMTHKFTDPVPLYTLYGVIVHLGPSQHDGHYIAFVKDTNGKWYKCDDEEVEEVNEEQVLEANAYLLFYIQDDHTTRFVV